MRHHKAKKILYIASMILFVLGAIHTQQTAAFTRFGHMSPRGRNFQSPSRFRNYRPTQYYRRPAPRQYHHPAHQMPVRRETVKELPSGAFEITILGRRGERFQVEHNYLKGSLVLEVRSVGGYPGNYFKRWTLPDNVDISNMRAYYRQSGGVVINIPRSQGPIDASPMPDFKAEAAPTPQESKVEAAERQPGWIVGWDDPEGQLLEAYNESDASGVHISDEHFVENYPKARGAIEGWTDTRGTFRTY